MIYWRIIKDIIDDAQIEIKKEKKEMATIGIDLGTTNSLVSVWQDGKVKLIPNEFGEYLTPSVVSVTDNNIYVGKAAVEMVNILPRNPLTAFSFSATQTSHSSWSSGFSR